MLLKPNARLVAIHQARYFKRKDGLALGPGAFVKGLEYSAGVQAHVVGKPSADFFRAALDGVEPEAAIMIGDVSVRGPTGLNAAAVVSCRYLLPGEREVRLRGMVGDPLIFIFIARFQITSKTKY